MIRHFHRSYVETVYSEEEIAHFEKQFFINLPIQLFGTKCAQLTVNSDVFEIQQFTTFVSAVAF